MGIGDFFKKEKYVLEVYYDNQWLFDISTPIKGQLFHLNDKRKIAFLIPKSLKPDIRGNKHIIRYDIRDAAPLGELYKICPDLVNMVESRFEKMKIHPDFERAKSEDAKFEVITDLFESNPAPAPVTAVATVPSKMDQIWKTLDNLHEYFTQHKDQHHLFLAWQWGYIQKEGWYLKLQDPPLIEEIAFPKKIEQLGVHPQVLHNIFSSTFVADIVRRKEPEWAWLKEVIVPFLIIGGFIALVWLIVSHK